MSFNHCGDKYSSERKSDWKTNPSAFQNIVNAISECGLNASLKTVDISYNVLDRSDVEKMFSDQGMTKASKFQVVSESDTDPGEYR